MLYCFPGGVDTLQPWKCATLYLSPFKFHCAYLYTHCAYNNMHIYIVHIYSYLYCAYICISIYLCIYMHIYIIIVHIYAYLYCAYICLLVKCILYNWNGSEALPWPPELMTACEWYIIIITWLHACINFIYQSTMTYINHALV